MSRKGGEVKVVIVNGLTYIGIVTEFSKNYLIQDALQIQFNPANGKVGLIPPLFGKVGNVEVNYPQNINIYDADDKLTEQYNKAVTAYKTGIVPVDRIPQEQPTENFPKLKLK
jgi:hypothetical protein